MISKRRIKIKLKREIESALMKLLSSNKLIKYNQEGYETIEKTVSQILDKYKIILVKNGWRKIALKAKFTYDDGVEE